MDEINFRAPLNTLGFGIFSILYYKKLSSFVPRINWKVINESTLDRETIRKLCKTFQVRENDVLRSIERDLNPKLPLFTIWHHHDLRYQDYDIRALIHFETSQFNLNELRSISNVTKVGCCSQWGKNVLDYNLKCLTHPPETFVLDGVYPVENMLLCPEIFNDGVESIRNFTNVENVFVSAGKWEARKQQFRMLSSKFIDATSRPTLILGIWNNPFTGGLTKPIESLLAAGYKHTNVLVMSSYDKRFTIQVHIYENDSKLKFGLIDYIEDMSVMHALWRSCDGYITLSAGEGWDQPLIEAIAWKIPYMSTYNSAHTEYTLNIYPYSVMCGTEEANDGQFFLGDKGIWYPPTEDHLCRTWSDFTVASRDIRRGHFDNLGYRRYHELYRLSVENLFIKDFLA